jgi:hypothetical protein
VLVAPVAVADAEARLRELKRRWSEFHAVSEIRWMPWRKSHGTAAACGRLITSETCPADELPSASGSESVGSPKRVAIGQAEGGLAVDHLESAIFC